MVLDLTQIFCLWNVAPFLGEQGEVKALPVWPLGEENSPMVNFLSLGHPNLWIWILMLWKPPADILEISSCILAVKSSFRSWFILIKSISDPVSLEICWSDSCTHIYLITWGFNITLNQIFLPTEGFCIRNRLI